MVAEETTAAATAAVAAITVADVPATTAVGVEAAAATTTDGAVAETTRLGTMIAAGTGRTTMAVRVAGAAGELTIMR